MFKTFCSHNIEIVKNMVKPDVHVQLRLNHANIIGYFHAHFLYGFTRITCCNLGHGGTQPNSHFQNKTLLWLRMSLCFAFCDHPCIYIMDNNKTEVNGHGREITNTFVQNLYVYTICTYFASLVVCNATTEVSG